jgi:hypothetical protein
LKPYNTFHLIESFDAFANQFFRFRPGQPQMVPERNGQMRRVRPLLARQSAPLEAMHNRLDLGDALVESLFDCGYHD